MYAPALAHIALGAHVVATAVATLPPSFHRECLLVDRDPETYEMTFGKVSIKKPLHDALFLRAFQAGRPIQESVGMRVPIGLTRDRTRENIIRPDGTSPRCYIALQPSIPRQGDIVLASPMLRSATKDKSHLT